MMKRYAYGWITAIFFLVSIAGHWLFGWYAYVNEAAEHGQSPQLRTLPAHRRPRRSPRPSSVAAGWGEPRE